MSEFQEATPFFRAPTFRFIRPISQLVLAPGPCTYTSLEAETKSAHSTEAEAFFKEPPTSHQRGPADTAHDGGTTVPPNPLL